MACVECRVLEVNEEGQAHDAAVVIAFLAEDFEPGAGEGGFVERFGAADLRGCCVFILCYWWWCIMSRVCIVDQGDVCNRTMF